MVVALLVLAGPACDSVAPVAPEGTVLSVSISPTFISLNGSATVTVVARKSNGQPVNPGVEVFFSTTLGLIDDMATTDDSGVAVATLRGDGRPGDAEITVTSGAAAAVVSDPVQIGAFASLISLQATPSVVGTDGGEIDLLALVRDDRGSLLPNAVVNFGAEFGILSSGGAGIVTDVNGEATDVLEVTAADAAAAGTTFQVAAQTAGEDGALVEATFSVTIARLEPIAIFTASSGGSNVVVFNNQSTGAEPLKFAWDFTDNGTVDSTQRNPTHDYVNPGVYRVRLVVSNEFGSDSAVATLSVPL
jgi:hypothetical protein